MKRSLIIVALGLSVLACDENNNNPIAQVLDGGAAMRDGSATDSAQVLPDESVATLAEGEVVAVMNTLNQSEVTLSGLGQTTATSEDVRSFAAMMVTDHSAALTRGQALGIAPVESDVSRGLALESASTVTALNGQTGTTFDLLFMSLQVGAHMKALGAVNSLLAPNARRDDLRGEVETMRKAVLAHLSEALRIQAQVASPGDAGAGDAGDAADAGGIDATDGATDAAQDGATE